MKDLKGYLTAEEVNKLLRYAIRPLERLVISFLWHTGVRVSEMLSLKESDILWDERIIIVRALKKRGEVYRRIPIDSRTLQLLRDYITLKKKLPYLKRREKEKYGPNRVFPITRQAVFKIVRRVGRRAGITKVGDKPIHPHHLRHSFGIHWVKKGLPLRQLQMILGHSSIDTTAMYLQFSPTDLREEYDKLWRDEGD